MLKPASATEVFVCGSGATRALKRWPRRSAAEEKPEGGGRKRREPRRRTETVGEALDYLKRNTGPEGPNS